MSYTGHPKWDTPDDLTPERIGVSHASPDVAAAMRVDNYGGRSGKSIHRIPRSQWHIRREKSYFGDSLPALLNPLVLAVGRFVVEPITLQD